MSAFCSTFRHLLEGALVGHPDRARLTGLSFHEHLRDCAACRELLETEEALEVLLASWPRPELPPALSARLLERLREARRLEELLELDAPPAVPHGLAGRVLEAVVAEREQGLDARLDEWLDLAGDVEVPAGLAERVLHDLRAPMVARPGRLVGLRPMAAALLATLTLAGLWRFAGKQMSDVPDDGLELAMAVPSDELLSALPVLENWDVLFGDEDLDLATGMDFSGEDEALLDFAPGVTGPAGTAGANVERSER